MASTIKITVPDGFLEILGAHVPNEGLLSRWSFEALVIEAYREGLISRGKVGELLGLSFHDRERWLSERDVPYQYSDQELRSDREVLDDLLNT